MVETKQNVESENEKKPNAFDIYNEVISSYGGLERAIDAYSKAKKEKEKKQIENQVYQALLGEGYLQDKLPESVNPVDWAKGLLSILGGGKLSRNLDSLVDIALTDGVEVDKSNRESMALYNTLVAFDELARKFGVNGLEFIKEYKDIIKKLEDKDKSVSAEEVKDYVSHYVDKYIVPTLEENELASEEDIENIKKFYTATYLEDSRARDEVVMRAIKSKIIEDLGNHKEELYDISAKIASGYEKAVGKYLTEPGSLEFEKAYELYNGVKTVYETLANSMKPGNGNQKMSREDLARILMGA